MKLKGQNSKNVSTEEISQSLKKRERQDSNLRGQSPHDF